MKIRGLVQVFQDLAQKSPDRPFATTLDGQITFGALSGGADAMILRLWDAGVRPGDHVAVMMRNSPAALALIYGILRAGMVWVPVNPALVGEGLRHAITSIDATLVVCEVEACEALERSGAHARLGFLVLSDKGLPAPPPSPWQGELPEPGKLASIMFTSGTTGPAKGVQVSHVMLEMAVQGVAVVTDLRAGDRFFVWEPFYHVGGAQVILLPILHEITLAMVDRFSASRFWRQVTQSGSTHIHHLGGILQILLKQPAGPFDRAHKVRIAWGGGSTESSWRPFEERFGVQIRECYGMTEASSINTCNGEGVVGAVGRALPWFDLKVKDGEGRALGPGEGRGEIVITSSQAGAIFAGYYRAPGPTAQALRPDGFHTGDLGSWGEDGLLRFHGRMSDSIRCRGENVSAFEVESIVNLHPDVEESAMVGVPADIGEFEIQLFLRLKEGAAPEARAISDWLAGRLASYQRPRYIAFVEAFPKTPSQRIQKHLLPRAPSGRWDIEAREKGAAE